MNKLLLIALGGAFGSVLRYLVAGWMQKLIATPFPLGTLTVNVVGCLCIGVLAAIFAGPHLVREEYRLALTIGVLGGFTTFSTFGLETFEFINDGQWKSALINIALSNLACLVAVWLGYRITERIVGV
jgi:fluoride exporter